MGLDTAPLPTCVFRTLHQLVQEPPAAMIACPYDGETVLVHRIAPASPTVWPMLRDRHGSSDGTEIRLSPLSGGTSMSVPSDKLLKLARLV